MFIFTPCRLSFALCAFLALLVDAEHASHITVADPPCFWADCLHQRRELPI